jgi:hypothetical protein
MKNQVQKSISKLIFAGYTGSKNPVRNRPKIQFVKLDFSIIKFIVIVLECAPVAYLLTTQCGAFLLRVLHAPCHTGVKANLKENLSFDPSRYLHFTSFLYNNQTTIGVCAPSSFLITHRT